MIYTGIVIYPKGASVRPDPHTRNWEKYRLEFGALFEFDSFRTISDKEVWAELSDGYLALKYPGSVIERADYWETGSIIWPDNLYRHKHDWEFRPYIARVNRPDWKNPKMREAPEVFNFYGKRSKNSGQMRLNLRGWEDVLRNLNPGRNKWNYFTATNSGWFNLSGFPHWEMLAMGGSMYNVLEEVDGWARIETLRHDKPRLVRPHREPWLVQRFSVVTASNTSIDPPPGQLFCPIIQRYDQEIWVPLENLIKL